MFAKFCDILSKIAKSFDDNLLNFCDQSGAKVGNPSGKITTKKPPSIPETRDPTTTDGRGSVGGQMTTTG